MHCEKGGHYGRQACIVDVCYMQVHLSGNNISTVKPPPNHTSLPSMAATFSQHVSWQYCNHLGIPSSIVEILLFNSVFHDGVPPVSVSTLKL